MSYPDFVDLSQEQPAQRLDSMMENKKTWGRDSIDPEDYTIPVSTDAEGEIEAIVASLRREPLPAMALSPDQFDLPSSVRYEMALPRFARLLTRER